MSLTMLPLNTLILSKLNVRRTERDADIAALAEDIAARGLKQNLVVIPAMASTGEAAGGWENKWEVIAGGRRFQAMQLLVEADRLPADHEVPCLLEERDDASETSLSENLHKVAMNPADEFAAFQAIIAQRTDKHRESDKDAVVYTAKRFGATVSHVEGRLRLASLCPEVLDALRAHVIGVEAAKAYAATTDHDLQRKVFAEHEKDKWKGHKPEHIRSDIRGRTLPLDHPLVNFVGLVTYQAEGGRIEAEMFMGTQGQQRVVDVALVEKLAAKIAEAALPAVVKVDGMKSGLLAKGVGHNATWPKAPAGFDRTWYYEGDLSKAEAKKSIGVYAVDQDGTGLKRIGRFKPTKKEVPRAPAMTQEERDAAYRKSRIEQRAAQLAARSIVLEPPSMDDLEEALSLPRTNWVEPVRDNDAREPGTIEVALIVTIAKMDLPHFLANAEAQLDAEDARNAGLDEDEDDGTDELVTDEAEG